MKIIALRHRHRPVILQLVPPCEGRGGQGAGMVKEASWLAGHLR